MKKAIRTILLFINSSIDTIASLIKISFQSDLLTYNNINNIQHSKKKIKILGNGQSLGSKPILENDIYDYMVVNRHVLSSSYIELKPKYYVLIDPYFFFHENGRKILREIEEKTKWEMILFVAYSKKIKQSIKRNFRNKKVSIQFLNVIPFNGFNTIKYFLYKHNISLPRPQNVLVAAIYIGISLKYTEIELYGVEHSWLSNISINENNEVCLKNPHFFDLDNHPKIQTWKEIQDKDAKLHEVLRMYAFMFEAYHDLNSFAELENIKIKNCTPNSYIDAFTRMKQF